MVYDEVLIDNCIYRTFEPNIINSDDLVWHKDKRDRKVLVLSGENWMFQFDDELPSKLTEGETLIIKANVYHRLIKKHNSTTLRIKIIEGS